MDASEHSSQGDEPIPEPEFDNLPLLKEYVPIEDPRIPPSLRQLAISQVALFREAEYSLVTPPHIISCMCALQRYLLASTPIEGEQAWWICQAMARQMKHARIEVANPSPAGLRMRYGNRSDIWFEIHCEGQPTSYHLIADDFGRTTFVRPEDVPDERMIRIEVPSVPPTTLRDFLERLTSELDLAVPEEAKILAAQEQRRPVLMALYHPRREEVQRDLLMSAVRNELRGIASSRRDQTILNICDQYRNFLLDGETASQLALLCEVINQAWPKYRFVAEPFVTDNLDFLPEASLNGILHAFAQVGWGAASIKGAADAMQEKGENLQREAVSAPNFGVFYGSLYVSCLWLRGAMLAHRYLAESGYDKTGHERIAANACEEWLVVASTSISDGFKDSMDGRNASDRRRKIAHARAEQGETFAEDLATEFVEKDMLYPRFFRDSLLGRGATSE